MFCTLTMSPGDAPCGVAVVIFTVPPTLSYTAVVILCVTELNSTVPPLT